LSDLDGVVFGVTPDVQVGVSNLDAHVSVHQNAEFKRLDACGKRGGSVWLWSVRDHGGIAPVPCGVTNVVATGGPPVEGTEPPDKTSARNAARLLALGPGREDRSMRRARVALDEMKEKNSWIRDSPRFTMNL
jgi:hypothetical protein